MVENSNEFSSSDWFVNNCHASLNGWLFIDTLDRALPAIKCRSIKHDFDSLRFNYSYRSRLVHVDFSSDIDTTREHSCLIVYTNRVTSLQLWAYKEPTSKCRKNSHFALWNLHKHSRSTEMHENLSWFIIENGSDVVAGRQQRQQIESEINIEWLQNLLAQLHLQNALIAIEWICSFGRK